MRNIAENIFIERLVKNFSRSPIQKNKQQESDAELIQIPGTSLVIAITTDSIVEEIETGLYTDPYTIGWMTVLASASDLSAVGAEPLGILINETLTRYSATDFVKNIQKGINDACSFYKISVLGGDTNFSSRLHMGACAIGLIDDGKLLMRSGCKPGDFLFTSGRLGQGNSFAFNKLVLNNNSLKYQPKPKLRQAIILRQYASCCMDSSDGMIATIDQLMRINNVGFKIATPMKGWVHEDAIELSGREKIPLWWMLVGPHGEFELLFTIPSKLLDSFQEEAGLLDWNPIMLGEVTEIPSFHILIDNSPNFIDTVKIRNLFDEVKGNMVKYMEELSKINHQMKIYE